MKSRFRNILHRIFLCALTLQTLHIAAQQDSTATRKLWLAGGAVYAGTMVGLDALWYRNFPRSGFHTFNDNAQWLQMDKVGHAMTAYHINDAAHRALVGTGVARRRAALQAAGVSFMYLTGIEVLDGFSEAWGFSVGDQIANTAGIGLFLAQEMAWQDQRLRLKFSYLPSEFADQNPELLGTDWTERWLKDYNGQTYWLSANPTALGFAPDWWPQWLNLAAGYGATGMVDGRGESGISGPRTPIRQREYYLSLDVDLTRIPTQKRWVRILLDAAGFIKVPAPGFKYVPSEGFGGCLVCG